MTTWLVAGAPPPRSFDGFMTEFANRLLRLKMPIDALAFYSKHIHPMFPGNEVVWSGKRGIRRGTYAHDHIASLGYTETPFGQAIENARVYRYDLSVPATEPEADVLGVYRRANYTDLVVLPLFDVDGVVNKCMGYATRAEGGFTEHNVTMMRRLQAPLARICQHFTDKSDQTVSLETYLGRGIGQKILEGQILRGEGETISAVLLFVDLVGFTSFSNTTDNRDVINRLNMFFENIAASVEPNNGEILKFIGDGALVIFPVPDDLTAQEAAARDALSSVQEARKALRSTAVDQQFEFRAALHLGDIFYGNIGSSDRLDFTAIGPAVNLASRLLQEAARLDAKTVCSREFYEIAELQECEETVCDLKGFGEPVSVFRIV